MTDECKPGPDEPVEWVIRKGAYYYRENCQGYTADLAAAGRYTESKARAECTVEPWHMKAMHAPRSLVATPAEVAALREALAGTLGLIRKAQDIMTDYLIPDGINESEAIHDMLGLLDGPEQRAIEAAARAALTQEPTP